MRLTRSVLGFVGAVSSVACGGSDTSPSDDDANSGGADSGAFTLLYRDDFDTLDQTRWQLMTHSWGSNLALFSPQTASVDASVLSIRLLPAPMGTVDDTGTAKPFLGAEVRSRDTLTYGRVSARAKFARGSAVISSLVTIYTPWPADDWNEFDIECRGQSPNALQYNAQVYMGAPVTPPVTTSVSPTPDLFTDALPFDPSEDFHVYTIEWTPAGARFVVDGEERLHWDRNIARMVRPQNVLLTIWASSSAAWAGPVTDETTEAVASYDWVELYRFVP